MSHLLQISAYVDDVRAATHHVPWDSLSGRTIVVTGASGLIGSYVVDLLCEAPVPLSVIAWAAVVRAWRRASPPTIAADPVGTMRANIGYLDALLEGLRDSPARLVYVSSSEIYGRVDSGRRLVESDLGWIDLLSPRSSYPSSKRAAETLIASATAQYGTDAVIVRPGYVFGPSMSAHDDRVVPQFVRAALGERGAAYTIADPDGDRSIRQLATAIAALTGARLEAPEPTPGEPTPTPVVLNASALTGLGWTPVRGVEDGLAATVEVTRHRSREATSA